MNLWTLTGARRHPLIRSRSFGSTFSPKGAKGPRRGEAAQGLGNQGPSVPQWRDRLCQTEKSLKKIGKTGVRSQTERAAESK